MTIDLHTHSTASDGLVAPEDLVRLAAETGLTVIALTDHDTTAGLGRAAAALPGGLTLVPGAEISCSVEVPGGSISLHVLAYLFDAAEPAFAAVRAQIREHRAVRARRMADRLAADGHPIHWERVAQLAAGTVGRPHIAAAMVEAGLVPTVAAAFTRDWIGAGGPYWVGKEQPDVWRTLRLIRDAGGVSVFAHPFASRRGVTVGPDVIEQMARAGLGGVEVDHPDHDADERSRLRGLAADLGLIVTGSSDFHGSSKPQGLAAETTSRESYERLVAAATGAAPLHGPSPT
ncbi:putative metal-dependent phosphoesterase, PHP family [Frankia torreyi]|uniref:Putative metal-dependent phosphoesterase, PHP family n=2 Tax=Frankia TaxID=1854 RepID=A0A0D8BLF4_9ACTN|nr:PHP domain-containing protein [Frankia torreyi]KJE25098.1 putative metal-dependent phosphoesterase, PHP family [Frankia torreyi]